MPPPNPPPPAPESRAPATQTFEFITLTEDHKIDAQDRQTVRKQAMRNNTNRRRKGAESPCEPKEKETLTEAPVREQAALRRRFRLLPRVLQDLQERERPGSRAGMGTGTRMEAFETQWQLGRGNADVVEDGGTLDSMLDPVLRDMGQQGQWNADREAEEDMHATNHNREEETALSDMLISQYSASFLSPIPAPLNAMASLPDGGPERTRFLIHHNFTETTRSSSLMLSVRRAWFQLALTDIAFFNVCLSHYACTYSLLTGRGDPAESIAFTARSMRIVNERLGRAELATSDGTVAAVAGMVLHEIKSGDEAAVKVHLSGLQRMISLRGGIRRGKFPASIQRMIAWAELNALSVFFIEPHILPTSSPALDIPSYTRATLPRSPLSNTNTNTNTNTNPSPNRAISWAVIETDISKIFIDLRFLSSILESADSKNAGKVVDNMWYSDKTYLVQRSLVYLSQRPQSSSDGLLESLMCRAASLYVDSALRDQRFSVWAIGILVSTLMAETRAFLSSRNGDLSSEVDDAESGDYGSEQWEKLMWVCAFGAVAASGREMERRWFVRLFSRACGVLGIVGWDAAEAVLRQTLWDVRWELPKGALWKDALSLRMEESAAGERKR